MVGVLFYLIINYDFFVISFVDLLCIMTSCSRVAIYRDVMNSKAVPVVEDGDYTV